MRCSDHAVNIEVSQPSVTYSKTYCKTCGQLRRAQRSRSLEEHLDHWQINWIWNYSELSRSAQTKNSDSSAKSTAIQPIKMKFRLRVAMKIDGEIRHMLVPIRKEVTIRNAVKDIGICLKCEIIQQLFKFEPLSSNGKVRLRNCTTQQLYQIIT